MRPKLNTKTAGQAAVRRPWKVGLYKALQKPWETLSQYIKDTVCSSSLLLFLLPSSSSFSPDYSLFIFLLRLFSSSSTRLLSVSSFTLLFRFFFIIPFQVTQPSFFYSSLQCLRWRLKVPSNVGEQVNTRGKISFTLLESCFCGLILFNGHKWTKWIYHKKTFSFIFLLQSAVHRTVFLNIYTFFVYGWILQATKVFLFVCFYVECY